MMEQINVIELNDESTYPADSVLEKILGASWPAYSRLIEVFDDNGMTHEWRYYRDGKAWLCKVQKNRRTIVWMSAWKGYVKATIYFPERHIDEVLKLEISDATLKMIAGTKNVGTSKPCMFEIKDAGILADFKTVMNFKIRTR